MKISAKQANLLAKEIVKQLCAKGVQKVPDELKKQLQQFIEARKKLYSEKADIMERINRHEMSITKIVGNIKGLYGGDTLSRMIEKLEERNIPSVSEIEDEIILKSMFKNEEDMETFVSGIVKKYEKKMQRKVLSN